MSDSELTTAKYFQQIEAARSTAIAEQIDLPQQERRTATDAWAKASSWISLIGGRAIAVVLFVFAVGYFAGDGTKKKTYPIDWFLRLGREIGSNVREIRSQYGYNEQAGLGRTIPQIADVSV